VLRRAAVEYLRRRRKRTVADQYRSAYGAEPGLGQDFDGWQDEGSWPER
jgi:hypothetical protein